MFMDALSKRPEILQGKIYLAALLFLFAGLRRGEVCYLTHDDIRGNEITIQGKEVSREETTDSDVRKKGFWQPKWNRPRLIDLPEKISKK